jgi:hypothetical protein
LSQGTNQKQIEKEGVIMRCKTLPFSAVLSIFLPILAAEAQDVDVPGNLTMRDSTGPTVGNILKGGIPFVHNFGTENTFIGSNAGNLTMSGCCNTGTGFNALLRNTTGAGNTASGHLALSSNTGGDANTAIGPSALLSNTLGTGNTASGAAALFSNTTGGGNTASGNLALLSNTTGSVNTAIGVDALFSNTTGSNNTAAGFNALFSNTTGSNNTAVGPNADVSAGDLTNATAIGNGAIVNASDKIRLGNDSVTVIEGLVGFTANSDRNRQENFRAVRGEEVLRKIRRLNLTSWNYVGQEPTQFRHYGPAAQDFFDAFGNDGVGTIGTPTTITSTDIEGILMVAVQALARRNDDQAEQIAALKARLEALEFMMGGEVAGR